MRCRKEAKIRDGLGQVGCQIGERENLTVEMGEETAIDESGSFGSSMAVVNAHESDRWGSEDLGLVL